MADGDQDPIEALRRYLETAEDSRLARERVYETLRDHPGWLANLTVHKYMCMRGCQLARAFRVGGLTLLAVRDYKYSPGLNLQLSVEAARDQNTLDGERHWPSHVYDMDELAQWGDEAGAAVVCRHYRGMLTGRRVLTDCGNATPGRPGKPTRL